MLEIKLTLTGELKLADVRAFIDMTKGAPADHQIARYDMNGEMDALGVAVTNEDPRN